MKNEKETKEKLLISARNEFMEKGYMAASLRNICKKAGVTTGALYFFFKDKSDLFATLVQEPLDKLYAVMMGHYQEELKQVQHMNTLINNHSDDVEAVRQIMQYIYQYYDEFQLILAKSQGSQFEKSIDRFVTISENHYRILVDRMSEKWNLPKLDDYMIHWISHVQIDAFVELITHNVPEKEALRYVETIVAFLTGGWYTMYGIYGDGSNKDGGSKNEN